MQLRESELECPILLADQHNRLHPRVPVLETWSAAITVAVIPRSPPKEPRNQDMKELNLRG
jgi:hypothetical protein